MNHEQLLKGVQAIPDSASQSCGMPVTPGPSPVLDCTLRRQVQISEEVYQEASDRLIEAIGRRNYFCGSVVFEAGEVECRMITSVIVYRGCISCPDGDSDEISRLVPVWWEFHTDLHNEELPNDFQFDELKKYMNG